jgi:hypothetical protein
MLVKAMQLMIILVFTLVGITFEQKQQQNKTKNVERQRCSRHPKP